MLSIRQPAVAGMFYPADPGKLAAAVDELLAAAQRSQHDGAAPKALIVPHAGYVYSGPVAASAYSRLRSARDRIRRVVLMGPVHRVPVRGLALPGASAFATPLGTVPVDAAAVEQVRRMPQVVESAPAHALEHSLEVHLPFLQRALASFSLVPFAVGTATREEVAEVLDRLWGGDETLIVVSSDLSHYLPYDQAREIDAATAAMIRDLRSDIDHERACGGTPLNGLMLAANRRQLEVQLVDLRNSGDTAGGRDRVVGYGSFTVSAPQAFAANAGSTLIGIARAAIDEQLGGAESTAPHAAAWLQRPGATFVTLTYRGDLRGCIGSLEAKRALKLDVRENAVAAAFRDPRFKPLKRDEWTETYVEVSLLSALETLPIEDEASALRSLRPGVDGLVLEFGHHRGTFLPQVWEQLSTPEAFLLNLKRKAGLPPDFWQPGMRLARYTVAKWREQDCSSR
ncbi:MAG: AmmeMemoRadiSam system protein B [Burkholderiales bacterium]|nr:AmmeMemoRadiSam system protein B [Burkholderiales bacterium]